MVYQNVKAPVITTGGFLFKKNVFNVSVLCDKYILLNINLS